jgi:translocation and assembly module TamB
VVELRLAAPNQTLGLRDVQARLDPTPAGYDFTAAGGSRLGPFTTEGAILLPRQGQSRIEIARLDVTGTRAKGALAVVAGGFDGRLDFAGGGLSGDLRFSVPGAFQRIDGTIDAQSARLMDMVQVGRGSVTFSTLLDPDGTTLEAKGTARGVRGGGVTLAAIEGDARLVDGVGEVRASLRGSRGRGFALDTVTQVAAERLTDGR